MPFDLIAVQRLVQATREFLQREEVNPTALTMATLLAEAEECLVRMAELDSFAPETGLLELAPVMDLIQFLNDNSGKIKGENFSADLWAANQRFQQMVGGRGLEALTKRFFSDLIPGGTVDQQKRFWRELRPFIAPLYDTIGRRDSLRLFEVLGRVRGAGVSFEEMGFEIYKLVEVAGLTGTRQITTALETYGDRLRRFSLVETTDESMVLRVGLDGDERSEIVIERESGAVTEQPFYPVRPSREIVPQLREIILGTYRRLLPVLSQDSGGGERIARVMALWIVHLVLVTEMEAGFRFNAMQNVDGAQEAVDTLLVENSEERGKLRRQLEDLSKNELFDMETADLTFETYLFRWGWIYDRTVAGWEADSRLELVARQIADRLAFSDHYETVTEAAIRDAIELAPKLEEILVRGLKGQMSGIEVREIAETIIIAGFSSPDFDRFVREGAGTWIDTYLAVRAGFGSFPDSTVVHQVALTVANRSLSVVGDPAKLAEIVRETPRQLKIGLRLFEDSLRRKRIVPRWGTLPILTPALLMTLRVTDFAEPEDILLIWLKFYRFAVRCLEPHLEAIPLSEGGHAVDPILLITNLVFERTDGTMMNVYELSARWRRYFAEAISPLSGIPKPEKIAQKIANETLLKNGSAETAVGYAHKARRIFHESLSDLGMSMENIRTARGLAFVYCTVSLGERSAKKRVQEARKNRGGTGSGGGEGGSQPPPVATGGGTPEGGGYLMQRVEASELFHLGHSLVVRGAKVPPLGVSQGFLLERGASLSVPLQTVRQPAVELMTRVLVVP